MKRTNWLFLLLGSLAVAGVLAALVWVVLRRQSDGWRAEILEVQARWSRDRDRALVPESRSLPGNAWDDYRAALRRLPEPEVLVELGAKERGEILAPLSRGARRRSAELPFDVAFGFDGQDGIDVLSCLQLGEMLLAEARSLRERSEARAASDRLFELGVFARDLRAVGSVIFALVGTKLLHDLVDEGRMLLAGEPGLAEELARNLRALRGSTPGLEYTLCWERVGLMRLLADPARVSEQRRPGFVETLLTRHVAGSSLQAFAAVGATEKRPWADAQRALAALRDQLEQPGLLERLNPMRGSLLTAPLFGWPEAFRRCEARMALLQTLAEWRSGRRPPRAPDDPFGPSALVVHSAAHELCAWSRGPDGRDDGGRGDFAVDGKGPDIVLRLALR